MTMIDNKAQSTAKERPAKSADLDQDISYSMWRRGTGQRSSLATNSAATSQTTSTSVH
jgi:hypothetical protein